MQIEGLSDEVSFFMLLEEIQFDFLVQKHVTIHRFLYMCAPTRKPGSSRTKWNGDRGLQTQ